MGWDRFLKMIEEKLNDIPITKKKTVTEIAQEVIAGKWGNGNTRKTKLTKAGYNYGEVQAKVNELLSKKTTTTTKKSVTVIAKEVIQGKWGNGAERKKKLEQAGYNYTEVQKKVNQLLK
jgi:phenylpyruvate tautomerase PptA (4-oxalocrotonate tautomerase family)